MATKRRKNRIIKKIVRSAENGNDKKSIRLTGRLGEITTREENRAIGNSVAKRTLNKITDPLRNAAGLPARSLTASAGVAFPKIQPKVDANGKIIPQGTIQSPATAVRTQRDQIVYNQTGKLPSSGMNSQNSGALEANMGPATIADATSGKGGTTAPVRPAITPEKSVVDETFTEEDPTPAGGSTSSLVARSSTPSALSTSGVGGGIFGGNSNASVGGIQLNPDGTPALGSEFDYALTPEQRAEANARRREQDYYDKESKQSLSRSSIMRDAMRAFQGEIDAVNAVYADKLKQAKLAGADRLGSDRAENFNAGAVNSSFGNASRERVLDFNRGEEGAIYNEKLQLISQINSAARAVGDKYYEQKKAAKEAGLESYLTSIKGSNEAKKAIAEDVASNIYRANLSPEKIDKKQMETIAKNAGVSVRSIEDSFREIIEEAEKQAEEERLAAEKAARDGQFNLSEGQARYDAYGNLIASRSKTYAPKSGGGYGASINSTNRLSISPAAQSYIDRYNSGSATLDDIMKSIPGVGGQALRDEISMAIAAQKGTLPDFARNKITEAQGLINELLLNSKGKRSAVGSSFGKLIGDGSRGLQGKRVGFETKARQLAGILTLDNLGVLKGPLSDADREFIQVVSSGQNLNMSEADFDANLRRVLDKLAVKLGGSTGSVGTSPSNQLRDASGNLFDASQLTPQEYQEALADGLVPA